MCNTRNYEYYIETDSFVISQFHCSLTIYRRQLNPKLTAYAQWPVALLTLLTCSRFLLSSFLVKYVISVSVRLQHGTMVALCDYVYYFEYNVKRVTDSQIRSLAKRTLS